MGDFTENVRTAYEQYLLHDKDEALNLLSPGTNQHYYLTIIDAFKRASKTCEISKEIDELVKQFKDNYNNKETARISLQELFLRFDLAKTDEERDKIIERLDKEFVHGSYNYAKPADLKHKRSDSQDKSVIKETQRFEQSLVFSTEKVLESLYNNNHELNGLHKVLYNEVNFTKIADNVFNQFVQN